MLSLPPPDSLFDLSLEELATISVVTAASGFEQKSSLAPANVTVINDEEWQAMGARTLSEVLRTVPGLHISRTFQYDHTAIYLRGLSGDNSSKIKILIDGEEMSSMQDNGIFNGFHLPLSSFKRIEVIKGPGSAVYGADAFAGIINLVSYEFDEADSFIGGRAGSFDTYELGGRHSFALGEAKFQFSFDYIETADDDDRIVSSDLQTTLDAAFGTSASHAPGIIDEHYEIFTALAKWQWNKASVELFTWRNFDLGLSGGIAQALDPEGFSSVQYTEHRFNYDFSEYIKGELNFTFSYKKQKIKSTLNVLPSGAVLPIGSDGNLNFTSPTTVTLFSDGYIGTPSVRGENFVYRITHLLPLNDNHLFRWEVGYEKDNYRPLERKNFGPGVLNGNELVVDGQLTSVTDTPYIFLPNVDRNFYYLSIQDQWKLSQEVQLTIGARYDDYSDFGSTFNPRLSLIWQYNEKLKFKLFGGSAVQSPSIAQLYAQNNPVGLGNPNLKPEKIDTFESGISLEYFINQNMVLSASVFSYKAEDIVEFVFDEEVNGSVAENIGEYSGKGGEITLKWKPSSNITINANYSLISVEDKNNNDVADIPNNMAFIGVNWRVTEQWNANIDAKWIDKRARSVTDTRKDLDGYTWVTTKISRNNILPNLNLAIIANNLFDENAREPSNGSIAEDYPLAGRQILLEATYQF